MSAKYHLQTLINLAISDMHFSDEERELIYVIGQAHGLSKKEIDQMITQPEPIGDPESLNDSERFELLYNIVQLMKVDRKVYVVEVKYCEEVAIRLGYNKSVIKELSSKIFSNPSITTDKEHLQRVVQKNKKV